ncbi:MAG: 50S ribosomal protein L35 [Bacteroidetes bacterium]|nr:50S ribosomal protein L35 [Bacteroidota bacterium]MCL5739103.1 50S ribosomal protein L35 [Bacteroidota bacterium]
MPKTKTNRAMAKRIKRTASGKYLREKAFRSHILTSKTSKRKRQLRKAAVLDKTDTKRVRGMLNE